MSAWLEHVKKTMKENKGKPLKEVLKLAKASYSSVKKAGEKALSVTKKIAKKTKSVVKYAVTGKKSRKHGKKSRKQSKKSRRTRRRR